MIFKGNENSSIVKYFMRDYGGTPKIVARLYGSLNNSTIFKKSKVFSTINRTVSVAMIGNDILKKYKRFRELNKPREDSFIVKAYKYAVAEGVMNVPPQTVGSTDSDYIHASLKGLKWFVNNVNNGMHDNETSEFKFKGFHHCDDVFPDEFFQITEIDKAHMFAVHFEYKKHKYFCILKRDTLNSSREKFKIYAVLSTTNYVEVDYVINIMDIERIKSIGMDKYIIKYDGKRATPIERSTGVDVIIDSIDFEEFMKDICDVLAVGGRRGNMFVGNPGTGKTTILMKLEHELTQYPIIYVTADNLSDTDSIITLGMFMKMIGKCVVFIEDMDALNLADKSDKVQQFLSLLDSSMETVFIATINDSSLITPSVARTGRFDEILEIHEPRTHSSVYNVLKTAWARVNDSSEGFPKMVAGISWVTYFRLLRHKFTQSDYCEIAHKVHTKHKVLNNTTLMLSMKAVVKSRKNFEKYNQKKKKTSH